MCESLRLATSDVLAKGGRDQQEGAMHLGLIVGIGPAATDFYYRALIATFARAGAGLELTMAHADTATLLRHQAAGDFAAQLKIYCRLAERLQRAGAEALAITSVAGHFCVRQFSDVSPLPIIDLLTEVDREISARRLRTLGIIGTRTVMETRCYGLIRNATVIPPPPGLLQEVHEAYVAMATAGKVTNLQRATFVAAGRTLVADHGAEAVLLAGTDLALVFDHGDYGFATLDCASIHVTAIARAALK